MKAPGTSEAADSLLADFTSSGARAEDLSGNDADRLRALTDASLYYFCRLIMGYGDLTPDLHGDLTDYLGVWGYCLVDDVPEPRWVYYTDVDEANDAILEDYRRLMTQIPREHFKTSVGTVANSLWQLSREPHLPVAIFNEKQDNAKRWLRGIRELAEGNKLYQQLYRHILPPSIHFADTRTLGKSWKWNDNEMNFEGRRLGEVEYSLSAHGIESATTGGHWPKMILDDLISVKHMQSQAEMERARDWVRTHTSLMRPAEKSMAYVNCTPWGYGDIYTDLIRDYGYKVYRRSALEHPETREPDVVHGESIMPRKLTTKRLKAMYARDPFTFMAQYQCSAKPGRETGFDPEWLRYGQIDREWDSFTGDEGEPYFTIYPDHYSPEAYTCPKEALGGMSPPAKVPLKLMRKVLIMDPAPSDPAKRKQDPNARTAILVEGRDPWGRRYLLESWADRLDYMDVLGEVFRLAAKWKTSRLFVEEVVFSNVYRFWLQREQEKDGRFPFAGVRAIPLKPAGREKDDRITARQVAWRQGLYYLNKAETALFVNEFTEYPHGTTRDLMDCMGYDNDGGVLPRPLTDVEREATEGRRSTRDPITGYSQTF